MIAVNFLAGNDRDMIDSVVNDVVVFVFAVGTGADHIFGYICYPFAYNLCTH